MTAGPALLDVNVLIAVAWPNHEGHAAARAWFGSRSGNGWASTPVTESGFVRVSSNRRALPTATSPEIALTMLRQLTSMPGHRFWADDVRDVVGEHLDPATVLGHRQVTDGHLIALARQHRGTVVTFDAALASLAPDDVGVEVLVS